MKDITAISTDILVRALNADNNDKLLNFIAALFARKNMKLNDVKRIQKQIYEVLKIRNHLALMLHLIDMEDPRQMEMWDIDRITPDMFGEIPEEE